MEALLIASTAVSAVGSLVSTQQSAAAAKSEGQASQALAEYNARQLRYKAGQERAVSQQRAIDERRQARLAGSRARAVAAASGGSATDPTVMDILAALRGEGEYNAQSALYEGDEAAKGLEAQANNAIAEGQYAAATGRYKAKAIKRAGYMETVGTVLEGGASFYDKYWPEEETASGSYGKLTGGPARTRHNWG